MKLWNKDKMKGFIVGVLVVLILGTTTMVIAEPAIKSIKVVLGGIKIFVDGDIKVPTDVNGNVVEPIIYEGTTYLPVRALTNMLTDKDIHWDQQTQSVYIGAQPTAPSMPIDALDTYSGKDFYTGKSAKFSILGEEIVPFNSIYNKANQTGYNFAYYFSFDSTYMLKSNYSSINGYYVMPYEVLGKTQKGTLKFYSVDKYNSETLLKEYNIGSGDEAIKIDVNLLGVDILKIEANSGAFFNVTLKGIK